jgi:fumarate reductase flavoprotein subunit
MVTANTTAQLAQALGIPEEAFVETMDKYGKWQASGIDGEFGRKGEEMPRPLNQPPYYAIEVEPVLHHTMGGIKINSNAEVVDRNGKTIDGLYAAGEVTGGVHGGNRLGGNAVADIIVYGRIAGTSATESVLK